VAWVSLQRRTYHSAPPPPLRPFQGATWDKLLSAFICVHLRFTKNIDLIEFFLFSDLRLIVGALQPVDGCGFLLWRWRRGGRCTFLRIGGEGSIVLGFYAGVVWHPVVSLIIKVIHLIIAG
jgi:hypothetical protein